MQATPSEPDVRGRDFRVVRPKAPRRWSAAGTPKVDYLAFFGGAALVGTVALWVKASVWGPCESGGLCQLGPLPALIHVVINTFICVGLAAAPLLPRGEPEPVRAHWAAWVVAALITAAFLGVAKRMIEHG